MHVDSIDALSLKDNGDFGILKNEKEIKEVIENNLETFSDFHSQVKE